MDMSLDDLIRLKKAQREKSKATTSQNHTHNARSGQGTSKDRTSLSKFDRINAANDSESEEDEVPNQKVSVEFSKKIQELDHSKSGASTSYESQNRKFNGNAKSHQYRSERNQQEPDNRRNNDRVRDGRVNKSYRNNSDIHVPDTIRRSNYSNRGSEYSYRNNSDIHVPERDYTFRRPNYSNRGSEYSYRNNSDTFRRSNYSNRGSEFSRSDRNQDMRHMSPYQNRQRQTNNRTPYVYESSATGDEQIIVRKVIRPVGTGQKIQVNFDVTDLVRNQPPNTPVSMPLPKPQASTFNREARNQRTNMPPPHSISSLSSDSPSMPPLQSHFQPARIAAPVLAPPKLSFVQEKPRSLLPGQKAELVDAEMRNEVKDLMAIIKAKNEFRASQLFAYTGSRPHNGDCGFPNNAGCVGFDSLVTHANVETSSTGTHPTNALTRKKRIEYDDDDEDTNKLLLDIDAAIDNVGYI